MKARERAREGRAQSPADAGACAPCAPLALIRVGARDRSGRKNVQRHFGVENFEFAVAAVDDVFDAVECQ